MTPRPVLSLAVAAAALVLSGMAPAAAETLAPASDRSTAPARSGASPSYTLIHVSAVAGSDDQGDGSQLRPYQTITYALRIAPANSIVLLAPGEYSEASGERFPIYLKSGVTVQGSSVAGLGQSVIRGSGIFSSATSGLVHTTLVGVDGAGLGNVVVTNTGAAGYGLAVETGRPMIRQNQFIGSRYGGVYLFGDSAALIEDNQFRQNGVVGLAIAGQSTAEIRGNRFEQTGIGIRVAPGAQPLIINNIVVQNQEGLLLDGHAQPRLENNVIAQNRRNGVIEFQTAVKAETSEAVRTAIAPPPALQPVVPPAFEVEAVGPTPGPAAGLTTAGAPSPPVTLPRAEIMPPPARPVPTAEISPGPGRPAPEHSTSQAVLSSPPSPRDRSVAAEPAAPDHPGGSLQPAPPEVNQAGAAVAPNPAVPRSPMLVPDPTSLEVDQIAQQLPLLPLAPLPDSLPLVALTPAEIGASPAVDAIAASPSPASPSPLLATASTLPDPVVSTTSSPGPSPASAEQPRNLATVRERIRQLRQAGAAASPPAAETSEVAIPLQVIPPATETVALATPTSVPLSQDRPPAPTTAAGSAPDQSPLRVPPGNIPLGSGSPALATVTPRPAGVTPGGDLAPPPPPPSYAALLGLVYRVFVPAADGATQARVRDLVPDAFRVTVNGQRMMQVGAYADRETAEAQAATLREQGLTAQVEYTP